MDASHRHDRPLSVALALFLLFTIAIGSGLLTVSLIKEKQWHFSPANRRSLAGPGSSPPICRSSCGDCFPCRPIHVAIEQGQSILLEYYPEAWRCKCRDKLFIP